MPRAASVFVLLLAPVVARGAEPDRASGDLAIQARDILQRYCSECHTGSPDPGRSKLQVMDHKQLTAKGRNVAAVAPGARSQVLELVKDGSMPPANRSAPTPAEVAVLEKWANSGAPAFPPAFDDAFTLGALAADLDRATQKDATAPRRLRYVSFAHLVRDGRPLPDLLAAERQLSAALAVTTGTPVALEPVDPTATLYRIDLARLGWNTRELFEKMEGLKSAGIFVRPLRPFDLVLLEYPHAESRPAGDPLAKFLDGGNQIRPVPFVRGDWLTAALRRGESPTPLAEDIQSLVALERAFAGEKPNGPLVPGAPGAAGPLLVPKPVEGRTPVPPLSAWYTGDVVPEPVPFTLTAELVVDRQPVKSVAVDQSFKLRVRSDRRVFLTLLMIQADGEVRVQDIDGGDVLQADGPRELAPGPNGFRVVGIVTGCDSATEHFVLFASEVRVPPPTVVRSLHPEWPVWRFVFDTADRDAPDPNKVVRKVVPVPLRKK